MPNINPRQYNKGYELVAYWKHLDIENKNFYVDSNSLELIEKKTVDGAEEQKVAANFVPVTSMIGIKDDHRSMTVLTDRPIGGNSLTQGRLELLINRKTVDSDYGGMGK